MSERIQVVTSSNRYNSQQLHNADVTAWMRDDKQARQELQHINKVMQSIKYQENK